MGISPDQHWESSQNGKAMVLMLARLEKIELVKEICDWLIVQYGKHCSAGAVQAGASKDQATIVGNDAREQLQPLVDGMTVSTVYGNAERLLDVIFKRHHAGGPAAYAKTMAAFADLLRKRVVE